MHKMKNKQVKEKRDRIKVINRILKYSEIYSLQDLTSLTFPELLQIQETSLIKLKVRWAFRNRHSKS